MIYNSATDTTFDGLDLDKFTIPIAEKQIETRGYIYIIEDSVFPQHIKIGRTFDLKKRLAGYNTDKPFPTASFSYISKQFKDVIRAEKAILNHLYKKTQPTTFKKEWFEISHKELLVTTLTKAEEALI